MRTEERRATVPFEDRSALVTESRCDDAKAARDRLVQAMKTGHDLFQPKDEEMARSRSLESRGGSWGWCSRSKGFMKDTRFKWVSRGRYTAKGAGSNPKKRNARRGR